MPAHFAKKSKPKKKYKIKKLSLILMSLICLIFLGGAGTGGYKLYQGNKRQQEIMIETVALENAKAARIEAEKIADQQLAQQAIIANQERETWLVEWEARVQVERDKIATAKEKKRQELIALAKKAEEERARAEAARLEAIKKEQQRAAEEKERLAQEKIERSRLSATIRQQQAVLDQEQAEYRAMMPTPIVNLSVANIFQNPELPNGCEITSASMLLYYYGVDGDKCLLSDSYLAKQEFKDVDKVRVCGDPNQVYCGNPRYRQGGYYCFAAPLVAACNKVFESVNMPNRAMDITGSGESALLAQLDANRPVIAFATLSMGEAVTFEPSKWLIEGTGQHHIPFMNLHCVVLTGYDADFIYYNDPIKGPSQCKRSSFMRAYESIGSRALIIQ